MVKVGFIIHSKDNKLYFDTAIAYANGNNAILGNESIIVIPPSSELLIDDFPEHFTVVKCATDEEFSHHIVFWKIKALYQVCERTEDTIVSRQTFTMLCVHTNSVEDAPKSAFRISGGDIPINGDVKDEEIMDKFKTLVIEYAYRNPPTHGINYKGERTGCNIVFIGTENFPDISFVSIGDMHTEHFPDDVPDVNDDTLVDSIPAEDKSDEHIKEDTTCIPIVKPRIEYNKSKLEVKLICGWRSGQDLLKCWSRMFRTPYTWSQHGVEFSFTGDDDAECDFYIICNNTQHHKPGIHYEPSKTIVYRMEPLIETEPRFNNWIPPNKKEDFLYFLEHKDFRNNTEWWLTNNVTELDQTIINKEPGNCMSAVISGKYETGGHKYRVDLAKYLESNTDIKMHIYGFNNTHKFKNYIGPLPQTNKDEGLLKYKYTFAVENTNINNYFTEKITDAIVAECLCFYSGCDNIETFIDPRAFIRLPSDMKQAADVIREAISNNEWGKRINIIRREKKKIVNHYGCFTRACSLINMKAIVNFCRIVTRKEDATIIPGIDYNAVISNDMQMDEMNKLFRNYMFQTIRYEDVISAIEHYKLWKSCVDTGTYTCIIGGAANPNFCDHMSTVMSAIDGVEWDIICLNWSHRRDKSSELESRDVLTPLIPHVTKYGEFIDNRTVKTAGVDAGYLIHPRFAEKLVSHVDQYGFVLSVDLLIGYIHNVTDVKSYLFQKNMCSKTMITNSPILNVFRKDGNALSNKIMGLTYQINDSDDTFLLTKEQIDNLSNM